MRLDPTPAELSALGEIARHIETIEGAQMQIRLLLPQVRNGTYEIHRRFLVVDTKRTPHVSMRELKRAVTPEQFERIVSPGKLVKRVRRQYGPRR